MQNKDFQIMGMSGVNYNISDVEKFKSAIKLLSESISPSLKNSLLVCDNLITWNRNYSFLRDAFFMDILQSDSVSSVEKSIIWRTYILLYFAELSSHVEGDFLELGCSKGHTASQVVRKIKFQKLNKQYYLYDLFSWSKGDGHTKRPEHDDPLAYEKVVERFSNNEFVKIIKGSVPESFNQGFPSKIAFAHFDMNHHDPESGALREVLPRLSSGGCIVFDDYGWFGYNTQKNALDPIVEELIGPSILELPTGQGILIMPAHISSP